ncbi:hypothetical protein ACK3SF_00905 [Candidatus Nanosalina sp. VS9-1]|uniref:hypothetical protein n=1 Tax=Candidatus Nanosalina sp. VS9-1 TaxID=3388566 RepID=UPI0039DF3689
MIIIDSETRYDGENYKAIGAHGEGDEEFLYFAQPVKDQLEAHRNHDKLLNALLDGEEDEIVREASLEPSYSEPDTY